MDKSELKSYRLLRREVDQLQEQLAVLEAMKFSPRGTRLSLTPKGPAGAGGSVDDLLQRQERLQELYREQMAAKLALCEKILLAIDTLTAPVERLILRDRYVAGLSWQRICERLQCLGYSERQVYRLHGSALLHLAEV